MCPPMAYGAERRVQNPRFCSSSTSTYIYTATQPRAVQARRLGTKREAAPQINRKLIWDQTYRLKRRTQNYHRPDFCKDNGPAIKKICAHNSSNCRKQMGRLANASVAIDCSNFKRSTAATTLPQGQLERGLKQIERRGALPGQHPIRRRQNALAKIRRRRSVTKTRLQEKL